MRHGKREVNSERGKERKLAEDLRERLGAQSHCTPVPRCARCEFPVRARSRANGRASERASSGIAAGLLALEVFFIDNERK